MCGIFGTINLEIALEKVIPLLKHRGPDAQTTFSYKNIQLHHFRLSILDVIGGVQPMQYDDLVIVFNGEIYNHLEVREQLNLNCKTNSDTETILHAYKKLKAGCLDYFEGMFAFAIFDKSKNELFLARDRAGKKPLYIYNINDQYVFSSELNALNKTLNLEIDVKGIQQYLRGCTYGSQTPFLEVDELLPGSWMLIDCFTGKNKQKTWWNIVDSYESSKGTSLQDSINEFEPIFKKAVISRLDSSDLEVGTFLSGGIDSGLVTAFSAMHKKELKTYTVSFKGGDFDESELARLVSQKYGTNHTEIEISFDNLKNDFESIVYNYGEPFTDSSAIPSYYVSKEAKKHLTVILNGDGADEIFGGYRRYVAFDKMDLFKPNKLLKVISKSITKTIPRSNNKKSKYNYFYRLMSLMSGSGNETYWLATLDDFVGYENKFINFIDDLFIEIDQMISDYSNRTAAETLMLIDFHTILQGILLPKIDIATMAHSLEGRSPFLSRDVLEFSSKLSMSHKINGVTTKYMLREFAKKYLPSELITQPKRGFEIPLKKWVDVELYDIIHDALDNSNAYSYNFVDRNFILDILHKNISLPAEKRAKILYKLVCLEIWKSNLNY